MYLKYFHADFAVTVKSSENSANRNRNRIRQWYLTILRFTVYRVWKKITLHYCCESGHHASNKGLKLLLCLGGELESNPLLDPSFVPLGLSYPDRLPVAHFWKRSNWKRIFRWALPIPWECQLSLPVSGLSQESSLPWQYKHSCNFCACV